MASRDPSIEDYRLACVELTDATNRLSAVIERNTMALRWLSAMLEWSNTPWWKRGSVPKWNP